MVSCAVFSLLAFGTFRRLQFVVVAVMWWCHSWAIVIVACSCSCREQRQASRELWSLEMVAHACGRRRGTRGKRWTGEASVANWQLLHAKVANPVLVWFWLGQSRRTAYYWET